MAPVHGRFDLHDILSGLVKLDMPGTVSLGLLDRC